MSWQYSAIGMYGIHTQNFVQVSEGSTNFYNWLVELITGKDLMACRERADGLTVRLTPSIWENQFEFVGQVGKFLSNFKPKKGKWSDSA